MEPDYPAAHSMDTTWFAVDRDGYVGVFDSGDAGAVPEAVPDIHEDAGAVRARRLLSQQLEQCLAGLPAAGWVYGPIRHHGPLAPCFQHWPLAYPYEPLHNLLMFLDTREPVAEALAAGQARHVPAAEGVAVAWDALSLARFEQLHAEGHCLHCRFSWVGYDADPEDLTRGALFHFEHLNDAPVAGPYALETRPRRPLKVTDLPAGLGEEVGRVRFRELSFQETSFFHPLDHLPCRLWGNGWADMATGEEE